MEGSHVYGIFTRIQNQSNEALQAGSLLPAGEIAKKFNQWIAVLFTAIGKSIIESETGIINHYQIVQHKY